MTKAGRIAIGALVVVAILLSMTIRIVGVGQEGIITTFGSVSSEQHSGLVFKAPWPIQHIVYMNTQVQKEQADATSSTSDLQDVTVTLALNYNVDQNHVRDLYAKVGTDYVNRIIDPALQESIKATTAKFNATDLITQRPAVAQKALNLLESRLSADWIVVDQLSIVNLQFSAAFTQAIEQKQVAAQQVQQAQYALKTSQLNAQAQEAQKSSLSPSLLQKLAIDKWDGKLPATVVQSGSGDASVFGIPLAPTKGNS